MRWFSFVILAYVMLGLQIGLGGIAQFGSGQINFVLIAATFIAINAHRDPAMIGCFTLGLLQDIVGLGPIGTYALAYTTMAMLMAGTDRALAVEHPFTHFLVTLFGGLVVALILWLHGKIAAHGVPVPMTALLLGTFYTALLSLPVLWVLTKVRKSFRFRTGIGR
ncbi:MAG: rod shape-determining protein MreD [Burkholderiales bacterium]|nr:rod shape-determining protein MreD [Phycisphaerae bacterium]